MSCTQKTFWVNDIKQLVCEFSLIPSTDDSLELAMNKITRMAIILSVIIMFFSVKSGVVVLVIVFIFIMSFYYGNKSQKPAEGYTEIDNRPVTVIPQPPGFNDFYADPNDPDYISRNQLLVGFGNPKTRVQPIVAPPSHDLDAWAENGLVKRSQINDKKPFDLYTSGFSSPNPRKCEECMYVPCMCATMKKISTGGRMTQYDIYDPRFTGYGDQYRAYEEPVTGQTRFFYKDVDAIKMPNYVVRSKVDTLPWAPTYGPDKPFQGNHRELANNDFHESALTFRAEMQERLLRKRNAEMWQRRVAPISTNQQLGLGFNRSCL